MSRRTTSVRRVAAFALPWSLAASLCLGAVEPAPTSPAPAPPAPAVRMKLQDFVKDKAPEVKPEDKEDAKDKDKEQDKEKDKDEPPKDAKKGQSFTDRPLARALEVVKEKLDAAMAKHVAAQ